MHSKELIADIRHAVSLLDQAVMLSEERAALVELVKPRPGDTLVEAVKRWAEERRSR